jgi:hypothetical protein
MKYAVEMGSGASFMKIGLDIQKLKGWDKQRHRQHGDLISLFLFFQKKESKLKMNLCRLGISKFESADEAL